MESTAPLPVLKCTQCGGELHPDEGQSFLTCPYCAATVYVDKAQVVFHWYLRPTLTAEQSAAALARWMSGNQTVKDLDKKSQVTERTFQYFPIWYFKAGNKNNKNEVIRIKPAAATSITELNQLNLPAGDLIKYDSSVDADATEPTVPLDAARSWMDQSKDEIRESSLVHIPVYTFKYVYNNTTYTAIVEAATGVVLASLFPAKAEAPYFTVAGITAAVYLCIALVLLFASQSTGGGAVVLIAIIAGVVAAPFLMALAAGVAAKV